MGRKTEKQVMIIYKAREVFLNKGFFNTVMDDIAEAAGMTRRTLYRHFETKEEIAYETMMLIMREWNAYSYATYLKLEGSGILQLESFLSTLIDYMEEKPEIMRYLGEFDFFFKDNIVVNTVGVEDEEFDTTLSESDNLMLKLLNLGVVDGSIRENIDIEIMEATISNVLWSFGQRLGIRGETIIRETGHTGIELIRNQVAIYIMALRTK